MNKKGVSLIEVMVTLLVTSIGTLGVAALITTSTKVAAASWHMREACQIAQSQLETLEATGYSAMSDGSAIVTGSSGVAYSLNWMVLTVGQVKEVSLSIQWSDSAAANHGFTVKSQFSK